MSAPAEMSDELASISATLCQAEAILEMVGDYGEMPPHSGSAIYGAATIIRAAKQDLGRIEVAARAAGLPMPAGTGPSA